MDELAITLPMDDWEFTMAVLACRAADADLMRIVKGTEDAYGLIATRCKRIENEIRMAMYQGKFTRKAVKARNQ